MEYLKRAKERSVTAAPELRERVSKIIEDVREKGDDALFRYGEEFDQCTRGEFLVDRAEIEDAYREISPSMIRDIKSAAENIRRFAEAQRATLGELKDFSPQPGISLGHRILPVSSCGCYVPGGNYPLYSTALMLGIPAKIAGVPRICAASPIMKGANKIHPYTLVAMDIAGMDEVYALGGVQAIAAFTWGTRRIQPVDLIVGPGNSYVAEAKRQCYGQVGIDFVAGPSEVLVIADETAEPALVAADILAQCEHDPSAQGVVLTTSKSTGEAILGEVERQLASLETREIAGTAWADYGEVVVVSSLDEAADYANRRAPEHLEVQVRNADGFAEGLRNYGSLFMGKWTAEVFGDYASGTNHTLPTLRAARYTGGVWVGTFLKTCTCQSFTPEGMRALAPLVSRLARGEGLAGHANAADIRLK